MMHTGSSFRTLRTAGLVAMIAALVGVATYPAAAYPEPEIVSSSWQLDFEFAKPEVISVRLPTESRPRLYWYMTYTVRNNTGADQLFIPEAWLLTDAGDLILGNRGVPPSVFRAIEAYEDNPLLVSPTRAIGRLLQGEDNALDSVIIWPVPEHDVDQVHIFFEGLSGETHEVQDPLTGETRVLRKALMLEYDTPGDYAHIAQKPFILQEEKWVLR